MAPRSDGGSSGHRIGALGTAFDIVDELRGSGWVGVSELADGLGLPKSTAFVYLKTLEEEGYVVAKDGRYRVGLRFLEVGGERRQGMKIYRAAKQAVDELSAESGEVANLGTMEGGKRVLLYTSEPSEGVFDNAPTGEYTHMHWTALGKAMLGQLPDDRVDAIVDRHGLPQATERTITDRGALFDELDRVRERGYSVENEERREGIKAIGVPVEGDADPVVALSISGPERRIGDPEDGSPAVDVLKQTANLVELEYKHY